MPVSKHYKNGQTARQFRKKRNIRRAERQYIAKTEKIGAMRAMRVMNEEMIKKGGLSE